MASIRKWRSKWQVRWRELGGAHRPRTRLCRTKAVAEKLKDQIDDAHALGREWEPEAEQTDADGDVAPTDVEGAMIAHVIDIARVQKVGSATKRVRSLEVFKRFLVETHGTAAVPLSALTKQMLMDYAGWLALERTGLHGRARSAETVRKVLGGAQLFWAWLFENSEDFGITVPPPRKLKMRTPIQQRTVAPTWGEMDACIAACATEWHRHLAILMRFTGLRVNQAMRLQWSDVDMERGLLTVRGELGKTASEMKGRIVPLSPHLLALLAGWGAREGFIVKARRSSGPRERVARDRDMARAWTRAKVRTAAWKGRPHHAFRKGFTSGLKRLGADDEAVEVLVGHALGLRGTYVDEEAQPLLDAVNRIPPLTISNVIALAPKRAGEK